VTEWHLIDLFLLIYWSYASVNVIKQTLGYSSKINKVASYIVPPLSGISKGNYCIDLFSQWIEYETVIFVQW